MTTDRFNPDVDKTHAKCKDCDAELESPGQVTEHLNYNKHTVSILNPTRERRIESEVSWIVDNAITDALDELDNLIRRNHVTRAEITSALKWFSDFGDAWAEYATDEEDEEENLSADDDQRCKAISCAKRQNGWHDHWWDDYGACSRECAESYYGEGVVE